MIHIIYLAIIFILLIIIGTIIRTSRNIMETLDEIKSDKKYWDDYMKR